MLYQKQNIFAIGYPDWNSTVWMNIGSMKASGWELSLNWHDKVADFRYNVGLNLSAVKIKLLNSPVTVLSKLEVSTATKLSVMKTVA